MYRARAGRRVAAVMHPIAQHFGSSAARVDLRRSTAYFVCADGGLTIDDSEIEALTAAFKRGGTEFIKSLLRKTDPRIGRCWYIGDQWALCYDDPLSIPAVGK